MSPTALSIALAVIVSSFEPVEAGPVRMGAIGDAVTDEYTTSEDPSGQNWVDIIATQRSDEIDFGANDRWDEPRRRGYHSHRL